VVHLFTALKFGGHVTCL